MLRFSANLSLLFTELPLLQRFQAAKQHDFEAVEIQFPYELPAEQIKAALDEFGLKLVLFNVDADTLLQGGEGLAAVPEKQEQFRIAVEQTLEYAALLKPDVINVLPGRCLNQQRLDQYRQTFVNNLRYAADAFASIGMTTVFEAVNSIDMPGFIIDNSAAMLSVLEELKHPHLRMQYDIYHMSRMQEDCLSFLSRHIDSIGHIQFADCPGRGQPDTGDINFDALFAAISESAYQGWVGAEYKPLGHSADSLAWLKKYQATSPA